ncbi:hypothetical protein GGX14DRAFT_542189 [Mycena pura]|uniref:DUF6535 domain-containing protein n=1 Tax=Mycena pura TaxID=153505 RepID=A0AAD6VJ86_9AGAR|nr:hypothetical protein GGX14DRAFT_542189 [Mycena pura]
MSHESSAPPSQPRRAHIYEDRATPSLSPDCDQLINVLQSCFSDLLRKQDEIQKAVEALKPPVPVTDKKSTFWTSYMKLADEHDREFKEKYSTDLDTSLIFAGLFSAIGSAFIIQIQPQLTPEPPIKIVVAQSILYVSLFTTLLAALLAVLGKQWIVYYQAAGSRGTIEQRGLERQRKLDGLHKWKFDTVLQMFPLLLQLGLLLFSPGLSVYLWNTNVPIAIIVLAFTLLGFGAYLFLLGSAIFYPDSPFQTPLAPFLKQIISLTLEILKPLRTVRDWWMKLMQVIKQSMLQFRKAQAYLLPLFGPHSSSKSSNTLFEEDFPVTGFDELSAEAPAVLWVLETSTDPMMITAAGEMAIDLQWPLDLDLTLSMNRLDETVNHWLGSKQKMQEGIICSATSCCMAYCSLRLVARAAGHCPGKIGWLLSAMEDPPELTNAMRMYNEWLPVFDVLPTSRVIKWALYTIPSIEFKNHYGPLEKTIELFLDHLTPQNMPTLDEEDICNYLCCLISFFGPCDPRIMIQRAFKVFLMTQLFKNLQTTKIDPALAARLIKTTSDLLNMADSETQHGLKTRQVRNLIIEISQFCSALPQEDGWFDLVVSAAMLARARNTGFDYEGEQIHGIEPNVQWIYTALEHVRTVWAVSDLEKWDTRTDAAVDGLLALLAWNRPASLSDTPSEESLKIITQALSNNRNSACSAFFILTDAGSWFLDPLIQPILQNSAVLTQLGSVATKNAYKFISQYFELWVQLATISEWKHILFHNPSAWITVFSGVFAWNEEMLTRCNSVIRTFWVADVDDHHQFLNKYEQVWALAITALAKAWEAFEFTDFSAVCDFAHLSRATVSATLRVRYYLDRITKDISSHLRQNFLPGLGNILIQAAQNAMQTMLNNRQNTQINLIVDPERTEETWTRVAGLLHSLRQQISTKFEPGDGEVQLGGMARKYKNWFELEKLFEVEITSIESSLATNHVDHDGFT